MTPRPQVPQQGTASSTPRLQPIARPTGRGGGGGAGVTGQAANFASLSESLTKAIASIKRVDLEERREDEFLAGQAAAEEAPSGLSEKELIDQGIIPPSASKAWRKGFYNIQGRSQADRFRQEVLEPWMRENTAGQALVDENGVPLPRLDPLEELKRLRSEFISGMGMGSNVDFLTGYNTYADRDIDKAADAYTKTVNAFEEERVASLVTSDLGNGIQEWYETEGALPTTESLKAFSGKMKSLIDGYGVPLPDNPSEYGFIAIEQFVSERVRDENADLDAVGAFVHELLNHDGLNGNRNYADDPVYRERVDRLLSGLDSAENRAEARRNKQREERERMLRSNAALEFGALEAPELIELREELAAGTGVFADYSPDDRGVLMQYWATLITNSNNAGKVDREANTDQTIGFLMANKDFLSRQAAEDVMLSRAETHGVDLGRVQRTIDGIYGDERTELAREVQKTLASSSISGAETSLQTAYGPLTSNDQSAIQAKVAELKGALEANVSEAIEAGNPEQAQQFIDAFIEELAVLSKESTEKVNKSEENIRNGMDLLGTGDFNGAERAIRGQLNMDENRREVLLARIDSERESELNDHEITAARGVTADVYARLRGVLAGVSTQGAIGRLIGDPQFKQAADDKPQTAVTDKLGSLLVGQARAFYEANRQNYPNYASYKADLVKYMNNQVDELFEQHGSDDEKRAYSTLGRAQGGTLSEAFQSYKDAQEIGTATATLYTPSGPIASVREEVELALQSAEKGSRRPQVQLQAIRDVGSFDPASEEPMPRHERFQVGLWEVTRTEAMSGRAAFEYLAATRGFSVEEVVSGKVDASLPAAAIERMRRNRARVAEHKGMIYPGRRRSLPGKDAVRGSELFYSEAEYKQDREALLAHYDAILKSPGKSVDLDGQYILNKAVEQPGSVLIFGSLAEIDEYEKSPQHPYRALLKIPDESRADFIRLQRDLFQLKRNGGYIQ